MICDKASSVAKPRFRLASSRVSGVGWPPPLEANSAPGTTPARLSGRPGLFVAAAMASSTGDDLGV